MRIFASRENRGSSLIEIAVALTIVTIFAVAVPRVLADLNRNADNSLYQSAATRIAEGALAEALAADYATLTELSPAQIKSVPVTFTERGEPYTVNFGVERQVTVGGAIPREYRIITVRVYWPDGQSASAEGDVIKVTVRSQD